MAQWREIYTTTKQFKTGPEQVFMCKVPSNSIFYTRTRALTETADEMLTYPRQRDRFTYYNTQYKNTSVAEYLKLTFEGHFDKVIALHDAGKIDIEFEILKKEQMVNMSVNLRTYCTKLDNYIKEHLGDKIKKTVYTTEFVLTSCQVLRDFVKNICTEIDTLVVQFYHKYLNSATEFDIEYMDIIANTKEHLNRCGLNLIIEEHETMGRKIIVGPNKDDTMCIYTDPCKFDDAYGRLDDLLNFMGIEKQSKTFKSYEDMFGFINMFADLYKLYKNSLDTTFNGIFNCFKEPAQNSESEAA